MSLFFFARYLHFPGSRYDDFIMSFFGWNLPRRDLEKQIEQLRADCDALRQDNDALKQECDSLSEDLAATRSELAQAQAELGTLLDATSVLRDDREQLEAKNAELQAAVNRLTNMLWGRRTEKRYDNNQPKLFELELPPEELSEKQQEILAAEDILDEAAERKLLDDLRRRRKNRRLKRLEERGREEFPAHLERRRIVLDLDEEAKKGLVLLGTKIVERLRFEHANVYVEVIERREYVRPDDPDAGVLSVPPPLAIVPGVKYDFSVIAAILVMKMSFHQPTYRQQDFFGQAGYFMSRSTQNDLINYAATVTAPLFQEEWRLLLKQPILLGDDTHVRLLTRGALDEEALEKIGRRSGSRSREGPPGSVTSYAWLYTGLDDAAPYNVFHWSLTREDCWIDTHLASFEGVFVGDATGPNARLEQRSNGRIVHAGCNSHARREFVAAEKTHPTEAAKALSYYWLLYDIEERGKLLDEAGLLRLRQSEAVRVWQAFEKWADSPSLKSVLPKSPLGKAMGYFRNHRTALKRYLGDPRLPMDNNSSEQRIRPLVIGRRNWTFLGHPHAAASRLQLFSIASSAHRHHLKMQNYFEDILPKLAHARQHEPALLEPGSEYLQALLPDHWAAAHPSLVCGERREEREDVADTSRIRRIERRLAQREKRRAEMQARQAEQAPTT
jgi:transposase